MSRRIYNGFGIFLVFSQHVCEVGLFGSFDLFHPVMKCEFKGIIPSARAVSILSVMY